MEANLKKLELLYDYTKFHIGLYLILASAYITLATSKIGRKDALPILQPALVWIAVALFMVAGIAGGVIASGIPQSRSNSADEFLKEKIGPWNTALIPFTREGVGLYRAHGVLARPDFRRAVVCVFEVNRALWRA